MTRAPEGDSTDVQRYLRQFTGIQQRFLRPMARFDGQRLVDADAEIITRVKD